MNATGALPPDRVQGEALLAAAGLAGLRRAVDGVPADVSPAAGWPAFWCGFARQFDDLVLAQAHWQRAWDAFAAEHDEGGLDLAACGLVQGALLEQLTLADLPALMDRVCRAAPPAPPVLAHFALGARLLVAWSRRERVADHEAALGRALTALADGTEPEVALRAAVGAVAVLSMGLEPVAMDDLLAAGGALARSGRIGDAGAALWHLFVANARFYEAARAPEWLAELDAAERLAQACGARTLLLRVHVLRAAIELGRGQVDAGRASLQAARPLLVPSRHMDYWQFHYYSARHALLVGRAQDAWSHMQAGVRALRESGEDPARNSTAVMQQAFVLVALGRLGEAADAFAQAADLSVGAQATPCVAHLHLTRALEHWRAGAADETRAELHAGFAQARSIELTHFFRALPAVAAELCDAALALEVDADFAARAIALRALPGPDAGNDRWPWPLKLRALGGFTVERDGAPLRFGRKAPRRLLDLVRLMVSLGGRQVDSGRAAALLWPAAEGDEAAASLKSMLHRVRASFGADLLAVREGQISVDADLAWLDTWAFEHVCSRIDQLLAAGATLQGPERGELERRRRQLLALYRGHLFGEAELAAWALPLRDRLRSRFIRAVGALGQHLERGARTEEALALYRAALEQDNLAEELYQRLIACHLARGERAQALHAYRRCRELLRLVLGLAPSARTVALVANLQSD